MTALCNGGASQAQPGLGNTVIIPTSLISAGLALISPWLIPVAALIEGYTFDLISGCATDPPAQPVFTQTDALALVGGVFNPNLPALLAKVNQLIRYQFWFNYCQCASPTVTPLPAPAPLPPAGVTATGGATATPCFVGTWQGILPWSGHLINGKNFVDVAGVLLPVGGPAAFTPTTQVTFPQYPVPTTPGPFHMEWQMIVPTSPQHNPFSPLGNFSFYDITRTLIQIRSLAIGAPNAGAHTDRMDAPANAAYWGLELNGMDPPAGPYDTAFQIAMQTYCGGSRPGAANSCCPADPSLINLTQLTYELALSISQALPGAVRSYADATVHAGLTGAGSFTLHDNALALRAEVTGGLPVSRLYAGNPTYYFDVGHITPLISTTPYKGQRLVYQKQLITLPSLVDSIGYTFSNGVTVKITELVKGP